MPTIRALPRSVLAVAAVALCALAGPPVASAAAAPVTTASETWVGEVVNVSRICCKAAGTLPVRAAVRVRRVDGSGARTLVACAQGHSARLVLRGAVAVYSAECPGRPSGQIFAADLAAGGPPRVVAVAPSSIADLTASAGAVAFSTFGAAGAPVEVVDLATGTPVRTLRLDPGVALAGLLDDGTLVVVGGSTFDCAGEIALLAPDGGRTIVGTACGAPLAVGARIAYLREAAEPRTREVVVREADAQARVVGRLRLGTVLPELAFDGRRVAWTEDRCSDGVRALTVDLDAAAPPVAAGPARCPWSVAPRATVTAEGRLALVVRCPVGCADLLHVTADRRAGLPELRLRPTLALRRVIVAPGEHVVELPLTRRGQRVLQRVGRLAAHVRGDRLAGGRRVTVVAPRFAPGDRR